MANSLLRKVSSSDLARLKNQRPLPGHQYQPTDVEHLANVISHGAWIVPSLIALVFMAVTAMSGIHFTTAIIYGTALVLLFTTSTIFHVLSYIGKFSAWRNVFHIGDRAVIYLFIASSYTPWLLLKEFHSWAEEMLCLVWIMALLGVAYCYIFHEQYKWLEIVFYLMIGFCPALAIMDMKDWAGLSELAMGGAVYVLGIVFFKMDGVIPFAHAIWHCFVVVGAFCHFVAIYTYLLSTRSSSSLSAPPSSPSSSVDL